MQRIFEKSNRKANQSSPPISTTARSVPAKSNQFRQLSLKPRMQSTEGPVIQRDPQEDEAKKAAESDKQEAAQRDAAAKAALKTKEGKELVKKVKETAGDIASTEAGQTAISFGVMGLLPAIANQPTRGLVLSGFNILPQSSLIDLGFGKLGLKGVAADGTGLKLAEKDKGVFISDASVGFKLTPPSWITKKPPHSRLNFLNSIESLSGGVDFKASGDGQDLKFKGVKVGLTLLDRNTTLPRAFGGGPLSFGLTGKFGPDRQELGLSTLGGTLSANVGIGGKLPTALPPTDFDSVRDQVGLPGPIAAGTSVFLTFDFAKVLHNLTSKSK